jgi:large subunit ribosomal protein L23
MSNILIKPILTEKQTLISEKFTNRYAFKVVPEANKPAVKEAVEQLYKVNVEKVNIMNYLGKPKSRYTKSGVISGRTASFKKAIVTLKEGQTIDFFSNI